MYQKLTQGQMELSWPLCACFLFICFCMMWQHLLWTGLAKYKLVSASDATIICHPRDQKVSGKMQIRKQKMFQDVCTDYIFVFCK
jgi:hypothetical protein